jgi:hypothetical protein
VPLRDSLDGLSSELARVFEEKAEGVLADPWKARDAYIEVVLGSDAERTAFLDAWCIADGDQARALALRLLEMQRCAMLMFTSCGWFFNDLAGIETRQILLYAARALDLADSIEAGDVRDDFMERLSEAEGNGPEARNGRALFLDESRAARVSAPDIAADWVARQVAEVPGWDYVVWRAEGRWAAASTPEARSVAGEIRVTDRRTASNSDLRGRALARAPDRLRIEIRSESNGPGEAARSRTLERADLHPDTRSAIEETDEKSGERDATIGAIWATIETLAGAGAEGREEILGELDALLARAELDELELPLWALQNAWWRLTRNRAGPLDDVEASVAVRLGFAP